ncbi:MAG: nitroreductase family protein [Rikenellaceae bacterium]
MELKEILEKRRSIRKFSEKEVSRETIAALVEATFKAPSSRNSRSTHLIVIGNKQIIEQLSTMRDYGSSFIKGAPLFILIAGDRDATDLWEVNCSISATLLQLAATDLGLASCWVHVDARPQLKSEPQGATAEEHIRKYIDIPSNLSLLCGIAIGYSDFTPADLPQFDAATHLHMVE